MFYTSLYNYTLFNLETKKIQWTKKFEQTEKPQFLSESLLVFTEKPSNLIFCSTQTGNVITSVNLNNKIGYRRKIFITKNNFLYCHHSRTTANRENIACLDVAPLLIFLLIDKKHFSLNNAMIIHLILNALKNRKEITLTEALFDQLPQELSTALKRIIEDHNQELSQGNSQ